MAEPDRYPSPPPHTNGLPYPQPDESAQQQQQHQQQQQQYHDPQQQQSQSQPQHQQHQHGVNYAHGNEDAAGGSPASLGGEMRDTRRAAPDNNNNTHMHLHLAPSAPSSNQMGSFGNFGNAPGSMTPTNGMNAGAPQGSVAYAQASGSADSAPPAPDKHKDKRTKVSRACDECRRKKIRCDALDETANVPCTNCARYVREVTDLAWVILYLQSLTLARHQDWSAMCVQSSTHETRAK